MALTGTARRLTEAERAREPRSLAVIAWFAGEEFGSTGRPSRHTFPRRLTPDEAKSWREGFRAGRSERVCHSWHGFALCDGEHALAINPDWPWA